MIEFSKAPYQFFEPQPLEPLIAIERPLNHLLLRFQHKLKKRVVTGHGSEVKELIKSGARILYTPNHPTRTDPQLMGEVGRTMRIHTAFMAAYDIFLENKTQCWFMQKSASFSIDREGNDRKAMNTAIDTLKQGKYALTIFPEGNVYHTNDRLTPIMDGTSFIATKAHQMLKGEAPVYVVPVSIKYTHLTDVRPHLRSKLGEVAKAAAFSEWPSIEDPIEAVIKLGTHILSTYINEQTRHSFDQDLSDKSAEGIELILNQVTSTLISDLETELAIPTELDISLIERIRKVRSHIQRYREPKNRTAEFDEQRYIELFDRSIFAYRLYYYMKPYLKEHPTIDRYAETVARLHEDFFSKSSDPYAPRKAFVKVGKPISVQALLDANDGKAKKVLPVLSDHISYGIQSGIDEINASNTAIGSRLITE